TPKDCFFAPVGPCETAVCDPMSGMCVGQPDPSLENTACVDPTDLCTVGKVCNSGSCVGGMPKDCSSLDQGCYNGVCDTNNGVCVQQPVAMGMVCNSGSDQCNVGYCDAMQNCIPMPVLDGTPCDDFSVCTTGDSCTAGVCSGTLISNCTTYLEENFESCPPGGWILNPEWECGTPTSVGPSMAFGGSGVLGLDLDS